MIPKVDIFGEKYSQLCLGGSKLQNMSFLEGRKLLACASILGVNLVDCHHRYGNCEMIVSAFSSLKYMTKISAYKQVDNWEEVVDNSFFLLPSPTIFWISDLDDKVLFPKGEFLYRKLSPQIDICRLGITTENGFLAERFHSLHPECKNYMLPLFLHCDSDLVDSAQRLKRKGCNIFSIKPFDDGRCFDRGLSIRECLCFQKDLGVDVVVFGTSKVEHLKEVVEIWEKI